MIANAGKTASGEYVRCAVAPGNASLVASRRCIAMSLLLLCASSSSFVAFWPGCQSLFPLTTISKLSQRPPRPHKSICMHCYQGCCESVMESYRDPVPLNIWLTSVPPKPSGEECSCGNMARSCKPCPVWPAESASPLEALEPQNTAGCVILVSPCMLFPCIPGTR